MFVYAATIFSGAFLLFLAQPLIAKYILPWFGGGTGIWTTCMLFFQMVLLGGYGYAHLLARRLRPRAQALTQLVLLGAALALLPIRPDESWKPVGPGNPTLQILSLLIVTIGLPYFVLSATSPLMQHWFSRIHPGAAPFRLYALSNGGSLLALVSYPMLFEAQFTRAAQARLWGWGLLAYAVGSGWCALKLWRASLAANRPGVGAEAGTASAARPTFFQSACWLLLPACASVLLLATTNRMCQEVAVMPWLWVLPLALYLLSFIICFDHGRWYRRFPFVLALLASASGICWALFKGTDTPLFVQLGIYASGLFAGCMVCHGELYRLRPDPARLTGFYLMMAAGGALGGLFVAVAAPLIFSDYFELQWGLLLCVLLLIGLSARERPAARKWWPGHWACGALGVCAAGLGVAFWIQEHRFKSLIVERSRNFYGVLTVKEGGGAKENERVLVLRHGRTTHGLQFVDPAKAAWPTAYYGENSGVGLCLKALPAGQRRIGIVGLGIGTLATYAQAGESVHFYEINPEVQRLAESRFTYLSHCRGKVEVTLGDARLSLEREAAQGFDLLALDAFNSDAIPVHLLTREAFAIYQRHMKAQGVIAVHVSNKSMNLEPVIAKLARDLDYQLATIENAVPKDEPWIRNSIWMLLARDREVLDAAALRVAARPELTVAAQIPLWTDDFTSLFQVLGTASDLTRPTEFAQTQDRAAFELDQKGDFAGAIACLRSALKREPNSPALLNDLATLLFDSAEASLRNIPEALRLAEEACQLTHYLEPALVANLASIYSEVGRFPEAAVLAEKASVLATEAGDQAFAQQCRDLLAWFRAGRKYHDWKATVRGSRA